MALYAALDGLHLPRRDAGIEIACECHDGRCVGSRHALCGDIGIPDEGLCRNAGRPVGAKVRDVRDPGREQRSGGGEGRIANAG
jgi:hypothetical protein